MSIHLNFFEKLVIQKFNLGPAPMLDMLGILSFKAIETAIKIGVFDALEFRPWDGNELAEQLHAHPQGIAILLDALSSVGYVHKTKGKYSLTSQSKKWLLKSSPSNIASLFSHFNGMASRWDYLDQTIRSGTPPIMGYEWLDKRPELWDDYHAGLRATATLLSPEIISAVKIPISARHILDLGGSHGQYCIDFCRRYPHLTGTILDWPQAERVAHDTVSAYGMHDRVSFKAGDFLKDDLGEDNDVVLLFNVIRIFTPEKLKELFVKTHASTAQNGIIVIMDHVGHRSHSRFMQANSALILLELFNSTRGQTHNAKDISLWLNQAGFDNARTIKLRRSPCLGMVIAEKKG